MNIQGNVDHVSLKALCSWLYPSNYQESLLLDIKIDADTKPMYSIKADLKRDDLPACDSDLSEHDCWTVQKV